MMVTYEEAKKTALKLCNEKVDSCREFKKAYHFYKKRSEEEEFIGGYGIVILKNSGEAIGWTNFILNHNPETDPKEITF